MSPCEKIVSSNDVVRSYRLETVRTNATDSYTRPVNARLVGTWHLTDAYRGRAWVLLGEVGKGKREKGRSADGQLLPSSLFLFPLGPHVVTSLWAHTWGKVRPQLRNASNEIVVVGAPMFARHDQSFLWTAATANGSVLLTWEDFFLGNPYERVYNPPVSAQLELFPNGDFIARSNDVERVYRRVNPDDWDDDGIPNGADDAPLAPADTPQFGPHQTLPEGANADAYCWVDLIVRQANAQVTFTGDGASNLADPSFIAEDEAALWLHWPVPIHSHGTSMQGSFSHTEMRSHGAVQAHKPILRVSPRIAPASQLASLGGYVPPCEPSRNALLLSSTFQTFSKPSRTFTMQVVPAGLGGAFAWTNCCCRVSGSGCTFSISCGDSCSCGGCSATGYLEYEGYRLPAYGGSCGCGGSVDHPGDDQDPDKDPPLPGASATFSKRVVFFEDEYENAPGEEVAFKNTYRAVRPSGGEDDIVVTATFTENETGWSQTTIDKAMAIRLEFKPEVRAPENRNEGRHRYGVRELVRCTQVPSEPKVTWSLTAGEIIENEKRYRCPLYAASNPITACCGDSEYTPAISVVESQQVRVRNPLWDDFDAPVDEAGSIVMFLPLYICPLDVSFANIAVEEVPHEDHPNNGDVHTGYFARKDLALWWHHTRLNGAGKWRNVREANRMGGGEVFLNGVRQK